MSDDGYGTFVASDLCIPSRSRAADSPSVAIIIPTKNRPELLEEAIQSGLNQSHSPAEIIVVDDGSVPAINGVRLRREYGPSIHVIRNEESRGLAYSRNRGVEEATSEFVIHLDDDDLLAIDAVEQCLYVLHDSPEVDLLFFSVEGFGSGATHFNRVQPEGVARVMALANGAEVRPNVVLFDRRLFPALLQTVPSAFQRFMTKRTMWRAISELRWRAYRLDSSIPDDDTAKLRISGFLRDSEWARYAAAMCNKTALINRPLYFARCIGQSYSSRPENREIHRRQVIEMNEYLLRGADSLPELTPWKGKIQERLAHSYFDAAYQNNLIGNRMHAWRYLIKAATTRSSFGQVRLACKLCLP